MEGCAKFRGIVYVAPSVTDEADGLPVATNVDDHHGCYVPEITHEPSIIYEDDDKHCHITAGHCSKNIAIDNGYAVCGARESNEVKESAGTIECIKTEKCDGGTVPLEDDGEIRIITDGDISALTNTRGPIRSTPDETKVGPLVPSEKGTKENLTKREHPSLLAASDSSVEGRVIARASELEDKRHGAIHKEDKLAAAVVA